MKIPRKDADYEVGFGKPPKASQFKLGQSGNPLGRRKKQVPATFEQALLQELGRPIQVQVNGKMVSMTVMQVLIRQMAADGMKGKSHARRDAFRLIEKIPDDVVSGALAAKKKAMAERIFQVFDELQQYKRRFGKLPAQESSKSKEDGDA